MSCGGWLPRCCHRHPDLCMAADDAPSRIGTASPRWHCCIERSPHATASTSPLKDDRPWARSSVSALSWRPSMKESLHFAGLRQHISAQCNSALAATRPSRDARPPAGLSSRYRATTPGPRPGAPVEPPPGADGGAEATPGRGRARPRSGRCRRRRPRWPAATSRRCST